MSHDVSGDQATLSEETPPSHRASITQSVLELVTNRRIGNDGWLREAEIASALGISRTPVRDALRQLAGAGIVTIEPHKGARIRSYSPVEIEEIYRSRALVEPYVVGAGVQTITISEIQRLKNLSSQMRTISGDENRRKDLAELNRQFHSTLINAAEDHPLAGAARNLLIPLLLNRVMHSYDRVRAERSMDQHDELILAAEARDADWAASIMRSHILGGLSRFKHEAYTSSSSSEPPSGPTVDRATPAEG